MSNETKVDLTSDELTILTSLLMRTESNYKREIEIYQTLLKKAGINTRIVETKRIDAWETDSNFYYLTME